jgi:hypothetical protein
MRMWKGRLSDDHTTVLHAASRKDGMNILDAPRPAKLMYSVDELAELLGDHLPARERPQPRNPPHPCRLPAQVPRRRR